MTSISVHSSTLTMLQPFKKGDMTRDDVVIDFIEKHVPREFVRTMIREAEKGPGVPFEQVYEEHLRRRR
ncbi:MAG: hypothetical protein WB947_07430 [Thermoplasmata archaeon]